MAGDVKIITIKEEITKILLDNNIVAKEIILFGSRARKDQSEDSDYDLLLITKGAVSKEQKFRLASSIRRIMARQKIEVDIIIKNEAEAEEYRNMPCSVVMNAFLEGVRI